MQGRHHHHRQEQEAQVAHQGHQRGTHAGVHVGFRQQPLAQPALEHANGEQATEEDRHREQDVPRHDVQVAQHLATGAVPVAQADQQLARAGARRHQRQQHGKEQQRGAGDTAEDGAGLRLVAGRQAEGRGQCQAAGLAGRQQGLAQVAEEGGQQVGAGRHHTDPQQLGRQEVGQGQVAGQQRQGDQRHPHHDHERNQPGQAAGALQVMLAQGAAVAHQCRREDHGHYQRGQAVGRHGQRQAGADHAVDALHGQHDHQRQRQYLGEPAQGAGHMIMDRRQPPGRALQHQHGAAQAGDEGAEHHQGKEVIGQAADIGAQLGAAFQAPTEQGYRTGNGAQSGQADAQGQCTAAQATDRQPANHGVGEQAFEQPAYQRPDQDRAHQAGQEEPAVARTEGTGHRVGRLAAQVAQAVHVFVGGADQRLPERRRQRAGCAAGDLRVELAAAQVDDLGGQVTGRLGQLGGLFLLGEHRLPFRFERLALQREALGFVRLHRADDLELVVQLLHIGRTQGAQGIGLALDLHGGQAQLRQQVVVGIAGHALANLVEPIAQLREAGVLLQHRQFGGSQAGHWHGGCRPGRAGQCQHQGHHPKANTGKAAEPHRIFLFTLQSGGGFYAACADQKSAVSRNNL
ncbi:hypothetical protein PSPL106493_13145 [Pseudomonas plecoglossicida]